MPRLKLYLFLWIVFWFSIIGFVVWSNAAHAQAAPEPPSIGTLGTCALYSNTIKMHEPTTATNGTPLVELPAGKRFYGCMIKIWEVDELGNPLANTSTIGVPPAGGVGGTGSGGGVQEIGIPVDFEGKLVRATGFCANAFGLGPESKPMSYFVKGK